MKSQIQKKRKKEREWWNCGITNTGATFKGLLL